MSSTPLAEAGSGGDSTLTEDGFLDGKVRLLQPKTGYRAGTDAVFLAAAIPAKPGQHVLELGVGTGAVLCCLHARVSGVRVSGLDVQEDYLALAGKNLKRNRIKGVLYAGDIRQMPEALRGQTFDHVIANPPYYADDATTKASDEGKKHAHHSETVALDWVDAALKRTSPGGWVTFIHRAERLAELLTALDGRAGSTRILPITARAGRPAGRVIIQARKGNAGALKLLPPFVLHVGNAHNDDGDDFTRQARDVLRNAAPLIL